MDIKSFNHLPRVFKDCSNLSLATSQIPTSDKVVTKRKSEKSSNSNKALNCVKAVIISSITLLEVV